MKNLLPCNCPRCGSESLAVGVGVGPHAAKVSCEACGKFIKWLGKAQAAQLGFDDFQTPSNKQGVLF